MCVCVYYVNYNLPVQENNMLVENVLHLSSSSSSVLCADLLASHLCSHECKPPKCTPSILCFPSHH